MLDTQRQAVTERASQWNRRRRLFDESALLNWALVLHLNRDRACYKVLTINSCIQHVGVITLTIAAAYMVSARGSEDGMLTVSVTRDSVKFNSI